METYESLRPTNDGNASEAQAGETAYRTEEAERQTISSEQEKSLAKLRNLFESGKNLDEELKTISPARIDFWYLAAAKKLKEFPEMTYLDLSYSTLTPEQQQFIDGIIIASEEYANNLTKKEVAA